ncbi:MAG: hypothetical protein ACREPX_13685, partial [Rhodanobacteraceae bacterium]
MDATTTPRLHLTPQLCEGRRTTRARNSARITRALRCAVVTFACALSGCTGNEAPTAPQSVHTSTLAFQTSCDPALQTDFD